MSLRYFNVAGATERVGEVHRPGDAPASRTRCSRSRAAPALTLFGDDYPTPDGTPVRDYIHVADLADAHLAAPGSRPRRRRQAGRRWLCNLGTSSGFSVRDVLAVAEAVVGRPIPHTVGPRRAGDPPVLVASNARARSVLGWEPRRSTLDAMIGSAWAWRRAHPEGYRDAAPGAAQD